MKLGHRFDHIAIIGIGLIGSSIALAAREADMAGNISLYDQDDTVRARAFELGLGHVCDSVESAVRDADLVILCVPSGSMGVVGVRLPRS